MTAAANPSLPPAPRTTPRWHLAALAVVVLAVHAMVLRAAASRFDLGASPLPPTQPVVLPPLQTRRIEAPPPPAPPPPSATSRAAPPTPARAAVKSQPAQKQSLPDIEPIPQAIDLVAIQGIDEPSAEVLPPTPEPPPASETTAAPPNPVTLAPSAVLTYKMTGNAKGLDYYANAELVWRHEGSRYDARMTVSVLLLGARSMSSVGEVGADGLAPTRFTDKARNEYAAHFEPDKGLITFSANTPPAPWVRGAQDRVSVFLQLGGLLAGNPAAYPAGTTVAVYTAGPRAADTWTFQVEPEETLSLPLGDVRTIKLARQPQREYDQRVEVWLAPALGYLPVRNKITQSNGDFIDQQLSALARP